jgi:hypothetical protein
MMKNLTFETSINRKHFYSKFWSWNSFEVSYYKVAAHEHAFQDFPHVVYIQKMKVSNNERNRNQVWKNVSKYTPSNNIYLMQSMGCVVMKQQIAYLKIYIHIHHTWWNLGLTWSCKLINCLHDITRAYSHFLSLVSFALWLGSPQNVHWHNKHWLIQQS